MERFIFLILFILAPSLAVAGQGMGPGPGVKGYAATSCADSSCTGFLICQNFETATTGYDNSESWTATAGGGTVDPVDTTSKTGMPRGTQMLQLIRGSSATLTEISSFSGESEVYGHFLVNLTDATPATNSNIFARLWTGAGATLVSIYAASNDINAGDIGKLCFYITGDAWPAGWTCTSDTMSDGTTYHVWYHYKAASASPGNDGLMTIEFTAATTRTAVGSGSKFATRTHDVEGTVTKALPILNTDASFEAFFDQFLLRTTSIGTVCE